MSIFFLNDILAIDVGFRYIKIAQVRKKNNDSLVIMNYGLGDTPKGCIKNGAITNREAITSEIKKVIKENFLTSRNAKIVISGTNIISRIIMVEKVRDEDMDDAIKREIKECLPINLDEHRVDYKILDTIDDGKVKVFVTAVPKKIINSYLEMLSDLELKPLAVDIPANSVAKFFRKNITWIEHESLQKRQSFKHLQSLNTIAVIDLGSETTIVNILKNKIPEFNRVLLMGSSNIDAEIVKGLNIEKGKEDSAERYKKEYGIAFKQDINNEIEWECSNCAKIVVDEIIRHVKTCFDFYERRCAGDRVGRIYLIGGGSQMKGIGRYFEEKTKIPTYPVDLLHIEGVDFSDKLDTERINYLVNVLGAAL